MNHNIIKLAKSDEHKEDVLNKNKQKNYAEQLDEIFEDFNSKEVKNFKYVIKAWDIVAISLDTKEIVASHCKLVGGLIFLNEEYFNNRSDEFKIEIASEKDIGMMLNHQIEKQCYDIDDNLLWSKIHNVENGYYIYWDNFPTYGSRKARIMNIMLDDE